VAHRPVLLLQHIGCEPGAAYEDELDRHGLALARVRPDEGEPLPDWRGYGAIVAMGGPMAVYEQAEHPWLVAELQLISAAARAGAPVWGVCLGAQLLAAALGARVFPGPAPEIGVHAVTLTAEAAGDPVFAGAPGRFDCFHWHGDTYELPRGARRLARSRRYAQQAFAYRRAYGLQFHLEMGAELVAEWARVPAYAAGLAHLRGADPLAETLHRLRCVERETTALARELFVRFLAEVAGIAALTPPAPAA
jgi:GMP synthase-like glutamine amidotransferase